MTIIKWVLGIFFSLVIVAAGGGWLWLKTTLPSYQGQVKAPVSRHVGILRDDLGRAHILAPDELDAFFGLGLAMAQDRLFQMDLLRRAGRGRLAEVLGPDLVDVDRLFLALTAFKGPEELLAGQPEEMKRLAQAFSAGVNHFLAQGPLPLEFRVLGYKPEPWQPADSMAVNMVMAWELNLAWSNDLVAAAIGDKLGPKWVKEFFPDYRPEYPTIAPPGGYQSQAGLPLLQAGLKAKDFLGLGHVPGSNSWVLAGTRTTTGQPILANDPHLGFSQPPIWWEGTIIAGDLAVSGVFIPGIPLALIGHTPRHAWGLTNVMADDADFFIERLNPKNPDQYLAGSEWLPLKKVKRTIKVKGGQPLEQVFRLTRNGLIINDLKTPVPLRGRVLAMRWVAQDHTGEMAAYYQLAKARNLEEFDRAVSHYSCPGQNFIYADTAGHIGWRAGLKIPRRRGGYDGLLPVEGHSGANGWDGYLPFEAQPFLHDPPQGFIATANNKSVGPDYPHYISHYWESPDRIVRIRQLLTAKDKLSLEEVKAIQMDCRSLAAERTLPFLFKAYEGQQATDQESRALALLQDWDLQMTADSAPAAIFEMTYVRLFQETLSDDLGQVLKAYLANDYQADMAMRNWLEQDSPLFDDRTTPAKENRDAILRRSLTKALADLEKTLAKSRPAAWQWGHLHSVSFDHPFSGRSKLLDKLLNLGPYPVGGSLFTVNPTRYKL
ncbi:MAG: penicillin acylase family protein, partial [Deltaproteobacteria bacterium]|nr:penicillin acylase family protein [Deltaproteobacteria bacterium]